MKKNKLIEILNKIEGNPDIFLWNGLVGDFTDIDSVQETELIKQTFESYKESYRLERCRDKRICDYKLTEEEISSLKKNYNKNFKYECIHPYISYEEEYLNKNFKKKKVYLIDAKIKNETYSDRVGNIYY